MYVSDGRNILKVNQIKKLAVFLVFNVLRNRFKKLLQRLVCVHWVIVPHHSKQILIIDMEVSHILGSFQDDERMIFEFPWIAIAESTDVFRKGSFVRKK